MARTKQPLRRAPVLTRAQRAAVRDASKSATITITSATPRKSSGTTPRKTKSPSPARLERQKVMNKALADHAAQVVNMRYGKNGKRRFSSSPQKASPIKITIKTRTPTPRKTAASPRKRSSSRASGSVMTPGRLFKRTLVNKALAKEASKVVKQRRVVAKEAQKLIREQTNLAKAAKSLVKSPRRRGPQTPGGTHLLRGPSAGKKRGERMTLALKRIIDFNKRNPGKVSTFRASGAPTNSKTFVIPLNRANNDFGKAFIVQGGRPSAVLNESIKHLRRNLPSTLILVRRRVSKADGSHSTEATTFHLAVRDGQIHPTLQHKNIMSPATFNFLMREHA